MESFFPILVSGLDENLWQNKMEIFGAIDNNETSTLLSASEARMHAEVGDPRRTNAIIADDNRQYRNLLIVIGCIGGACITLIIIATVMALVTLWIIRLYATNIT